MPIALKTALNPDLTVLNEHPEKIRAYLSVLQTNLKMDLHQYELKYQRIIELSTLNCLALANQIPNQWVQIVKDLTHDAQRNLSRLPQAEFDQQIFKQLTLITDRLQNKMLKKIYLLDPDYVEATTPNYNFTIDDLDRLRRHQLKIEHFPYIKLKILEKMSQTAEYQDLNQFLLHFMQVRRWSKLILQNIVHLYHDVYQQHNPTMEVLINMYDYQFQKQGEV